MSIATLVPEPLWQNFSDLNAVPRPSKKEERVIQFIQQFAQKLGLEHSTDATGNVLVKKPASPGRENQPVLALQSHLDMVCQKNLGTDFDFETQGIRMRLEGDWVSAEGTTLGADNGIGVAAIMAVLASKDLVHPPLEALFTIDEETGMTGARGLEAGLMKASVMLNLDTEDDHELTIGCAGGLDVQARCSYPQAEVSDDFEFFEVRLKGLTGGHSGMDIHKGRANANKLMNRFLYAATLKFALRISSIDGGGLRNAIPRESSAVVAVSRKQAEDFKAYVLEESGHFASEYQSTDPQCQLSCAVIASRSPVLDRDFQNKLLCTVYAVNNGIYRMSPDVPGLVQTSNNLARLKVHNGEFSLACLTRSSLDSEKMDLATSLRCPLELMGAEVTFSGAYPGWTPRPEAGIVKLMSSIYQELFGKEPKVTACHAGLECGILGANYPDMEMISFGPNIHGAHSPDEKVQVSSVQKFWKLLTTTLARL
ncbi:aminoacyl-histidine dipeptidase [bacterium]|nr:aminoacyl-histidine dipeptidase [bacterium]